VDLTRCPVHHPLIASGIGALRSLLAKAPRLLSAGSSGEGWLRYAAFQVSELEGVLHLTLVTRSGEAEGLLRSLAARLREAVPELAGISWNVNPTGGNEIFGADWRPLWGEEHLREKLGDLVFRASPPSFLQANREQAGWVYRMASPWLAPGPSEDALDLYSGVGGLALHLAPRVRRVVGVEGSEAAVADAAWTAGASGIENAAFVAGRAEEVLPRLAAEGLRPSLASLNPPRKGAAPQVLEHLRRLRPHAVLYVSCDPDTLARDAALLCANGAYRPVMIQPVDFFPQTDHVETVALFHVGPV
jgi:23S rRNA (uracil1939-C5)-methyltransferase